MIVGCLGLLALALASEAQAQMFGRRNLGGGLERSSVTRAERPGEQPSASSQPTEVGVGVDERFIRGMRDEREFVGVETIDPGAFVGLQQGASRGAIRSAITALPELVNERINQPQAEVQPQRIQPYGPRLIVGFDYTPAPQQAVAAQLTTRLQQSAGIQRLGPIEVSVEGRTAILRGEVASAHDRSLAAELVRLEPGVSRVENHLSVAAEPENSVPLPTP